MIDDASFKGNKGGMFQSQWWELKSLYSRLTHNVTPSSTRIFVTALKWLVRIWVKEAIEELFLSHHTPSWFKVPVCVRAPSFMCFFHIGRDILTSSHQESPYPWFVECIYCFLRCFIGPKTCQFPHLKVALCSFSVSYFMPLLGHLSML